MRRSNQIKDNALRAGIATGTALFVAGCIFGGVGSILVAAPLVIGGLGMAAGCGYTWCKQPVEDDMQYTIDAGERSLPLVENMPNPRGRPMGSESPSPTDSPSPTRDLRFFSVEMYTPPSPATNGKEEAHSPEYHS